MPRPPLTVTLLDDRLLPTTGLLFFGSSYTDNQRSDTRVPDLVRQIAKYFQGPSVETATRASGSLRLADHAAAVDPAAVKLLMPDGVPADVAMLQGQSLEAAAGSVGASGVAAFVQGADDLTADVRGAFPAARIVLTETQARPASNHDFYPSKYANPAAMQADVKAGYDTALADLQQRFGADVRLAPVGEVFAELGFDPDLYESDSGQPSFYGALVTAMTVCATAFDDNVSGLPPYFVQVPPSTIFDYNAIVPAEHAVDVVVARQNVARDEAFVRRLYADVLGREPDAGGLADWKNHLADGLGRERVADGIVNSVEHLTPQIRGLYRTLLGRDASRQEELDAIANAQSGSYSQSGKYYLASGIEAVRSQLLTSDEYLARAGGPADGAVVRQWYRDILGREASSNEVAELLPIVQDEFGRRYAVSRLLHSEESVTPLIRATYRQYLGRVEDARGLTDYQNALRNVSLNQFELWILASGEYYNRTP